MEQFQPTPLGGALLLTVALYLRLGFLISCPVALHRCVPVYEAIVSVSSGCCVALLLSLTLSFRSNRPFLGNSSGTAPAHALPFSPAPPTTPLKQPNYHIPFSLKPIFREGRGPIPGVTLKDLRPGPGGGSSKGQRERSLEPSILLGSTDASHRGNKLSMEAQ
ncbi:unnamed protein product [Boreogadus saida]